MTLINTSLAEGVGFITLDNDDKYNLLGERFAYEIGVALDGFERENARAVILRANPGVKVWSAGYDVEALPAVGHDPLQWADPLRKLVRDIQSFSAPVIAQVTGSVWGGACEAVFACDLIVASPASTFAVTPARLGIPYNPTGLTTFLNAVPLAVVKEMLFSARPLSAARLERLGAVNHVVEEAEIGAFCEQLAADIAANAPLAVAVMKEQLRLLSAAPPLSAQEFERIQGQRRVVYGSEDYAEGRRALVEKRKPEFRGE
ncbi:methylmalonyl-CoA decarboxylase [Denitratisoma sp. agr-D3]